MDILKQIYKEMENLKCDDSELCDADPDDFPSIEYNNAIDKCLRVIEKYLS